MVIIDTVVNTLFGGLTLDPAGMHCPSWDDAFVSSSFCCLFDIIQRLTQSLSSFHWTCPNHLNLLFLIIKLTGSNPKSSLEFFTFLPVIQLNPTHPSDHTHFNAIHLQFMLRPVIESHQQSAKFSSLGNLWFERPGLAWSYLQENGPVTRSWKIVGGSRGGGSGSSGSLLVSRKGYCSSSSVPWLHRSIEPY